jgi:DNA polymerase III epsilon subunit-like protein
MIVLDIETTGLTIREGVFQIGAFELENPNNYFFQDSRIDEDDEINENALKVNGKTREEVRDPNKQTQKQMIENFLEWAAQFSERIVLGANIGFDIQMILGKCLKYRISERFNEIVGHKGLDILTLAQEEYFRINGKYLVNSKGVSGMSLAEALRFSGISDARIGLEFTGEIINQGKFHNALEDCRLEAECYFRIKFGKSLFPEYSGFKVPGYLEK